MKELDELDKELLRILQENAETPYSQISAKLGISKAAIYKRLKELKKRGVIKKICAVVDPKLLGKKLKAFVGISTEPGTCPEVIEELRMRSEILEIHEMAGEHDLLLKVIVNDTEQLNAFLHEIDKLPGISGSRTLVVLKTEKETSFVEP